MEHFEDLVWKDVAEAGGYEACDMRLLYDSLYNTFSKAMKNKRLLFQINIQVEHFNVPCDTTKQKEILLNLLSNALKYTPAGGRVRMDVTESSSPREGYAIYQTIVQDNGIGMSQEFVSQVFDAFT